MNLSPTPSQVKDRLSAKHELELVSAVNNNVNGLKGVSPRWVAMTHGLNLGDVLACFKREEALGHVESYDVNGEIYWRRKAGQMTSTPLA